MTSHPLGVDSSEHDLIIGDSFNKSSNTAFHSMRFDFKPASVDPSQPAVLAVNDNNNVTVTVPHIEQGFNKGQTHTVYKGNKRPVQKDCVLIIDHETGDITLEKLSYHLALKKTRAERPTPLIAPAQPPRMTTDIKKLKNMNKKPIKKEKEAKAAREATPTPSTTSTPTPPPSNPSPAPASQAKLSFSSDSDSDMDLSPVKPSPVKPVAAMPEPATQKSYGHAGVNLSEDLLLSESGSDSD